MISSQDKFSLTNQILSCLPFIHLIYLQLHIELIYMMKISYCIESSTILHRIAYSRQGNSQHPNILLNVPCFLIWSFTMYLKYKYCLFYLTKLNKFNIFLDLGDNSRTLLVILVFLLICYPSIIVALPLVRIIYPVSTVLCTRRITP